MDVIADILAGFAALAAAGYCLILSRRLKRFNQLEGGMGGAIAVLSAQVDDMTKALDRAQSTAAVSARQLSELTERAERGAQRLELMLASLHDNPASPREAQRHRLVRRRVREGSVEAAE